ncbi:MAG: protein kinase [Candidatus Marinimicrobia bacterium]|jgi:serine/threonine-protein kinase|nr:protein kinase [Candidatus Neomarinimicrobiota bacterium]
MQLPYLLGSYTLIEEIGRGGMGIVYRGQHNVLERPVAVKMLSPYLVSDQELKARFYSEAKLQASLTHHGMVTLYEFLEEKGNLFLVMELVKGRPLSKVIGKEVGPMPAERAVHVFTQILDAFSYAHNHSVVHRDAKPANILITKDDVVKITDFGIARIIGQVGLTQTGQKVGTPHYMSPEQVLGKLIDLRSDIYTLGITFYEMIAGRLPMDSDTEFNIMEFHIKHNPPDPREFYPHIPDELVQAVFKSLEKDPSKRFQSCRDFKLAIGSTSSGSDSPTETYRVMVESACADGVISDDERRMLEQLRLNLGLSKTAANKIENEYSSNQTEIIYCIYCGNENSRSNSYCIKCGKKIYNR